MKTYNVKYNVGQDVYALSSKKIIQTKIDKIRITESVPYVKGETMKEMDGIEIEYLLMTNETHNPSGGHIYSYDWYNQDDVFASKDDVIRNII